MSYFVINYGPYFNMCKKIYISCRFLLLISMHIVWLMKKWWRIPTCSFWQSKALATDATLSRHNAGVHNARNLQSMHGFPLMKACSTKCCLNIFIGSCLPDQFQCKDYSCVSSSLRCNGMSDCSDLSDEYSCGIRCIFLKALSIKFIVFV